MTVSPISASMMSMYVPLAVTEKSDAQDYEYQLIAQQLQAYGITPSGDKETDERKLEIIETMIQMQESQESSKTRQSIPFEDIMNTLNLTVTGDLDEDYETTIDELDYEIDMAYTDEEKEYFEALKDQVEAEYNSSKENSISYYSNIDQASLMSRYFLGV